MEFEIKLNPAVASVDLMIKFRLFKLKPILKKAKFKTNSVLKIAL